MPGMGTGLSENDPTIVSAFHAALLRQFLFVLLILVFVAAAWSVLRGVQLRWAAAGCLRLCRARSGELPLGHQLAQRRRARVMDIADLLQLVLLSVIIVGQNVLAAAADKRAEATFNDADAVLHEAVKIQEHLLAQDEVLERLMNNMTRA